VDHLSVAEAAEALGITQAAIYKRIQRGTIPHDKDSEGHVFVYLDTSDIQADESMNVSTDMSDRDELIAELRSHNAHLRQEVEDWKEEARRKDHLLAAALERIPAIESAPPDTPSSSPSPEPRESPVSDEEGPPYGTAPQDAEESLHHVPYGEASPGWRGDTEEPRVPWWRRWFGG
jgi:predicted DNA-binding transcriptional regulator AlpA